MSLSTLQFLFLILDRRSGATDDQIVPTASYVTTSMAECQVIVKFADPKQTEAVDLILETDDPADLFARMFDGLSNDLFVGQGLARAWVREQWVIDRAERVESRVVATGLVDRVMVSEIVEDGERGIFAVMLGLDRALDHANPFSASHEVRGLYAIAVRYARTAKLNTAAVPGRLLFSCAFAGRPLGLPEKAQYFGMHRTYNTSGDHRWIWPEDDIVVDRDPVTHRAVIIVGFAPLLGDSDLKIEKRVYPDGTRYRFEPIASQNLGERIERILNRLDSSGASIAVLPEASLSNELYEAWLEVLDRTPCPIGGSLKWLLLGSGPLGQAEPPHNRAILIDRQTHTHTHPHVLLKHDKMFDYPIDSWSLSDMKMSDELGEENATEDITVGQTLDTRESQLGRLAILICEDLGRTSSMFAIASAGVSHAFIPILSKEVTESGWAVNPAKQIVNDCGTWVAVANSLAIPNRQHAKKEGSARKVKTSFTIGPHDGSRRNGYIQPSFAECCEPEDVVTLTMSVAVTYRWMDLKDYRGRNL